MHRLNQEIVGVGFALGHFRGFSHVHRALCISYFLKEIKGKASNIRHYIGFHNSSLKTKPLWAFMKPKPGVECGSWASKALRRLSRCNIGVATAVQSEHID